MVHSPITPAELTEEHIDMLTCTGGLPLSIRCTYGDAADDLAGGRRDTAAVLVTVAAFNALVPGWLARVARAIGIRP